MSFIWFFLASRFFEVLRIINHTYLKGGPGFVDVSMSKQPAYMAMMTRDESFAYSLAAILLAY